MTEESIDLMAALQASLERAKAARVAIEPAKGGEVTEPEHPDVEEGTP